MAQTWHINKTKKAWILLCFFFFYLLCYAIFSTSEEICFTPQETKERVHKLVEREWGKGGEEKG